MRKFMCNDISDPLFVAFRGNFRVKQHGRLPVRNQSPVFHGSWSEIWYGDHICVEKRKRFDPVLWQKPPYHQKMTVKRQQKDATNNFDNTTISDWHRTVSWSNYCHHLEYPLVLSRFCIQLGDKYKQCRYLKLLLLYASFFAHVEFSC